MNKFDLTVPASSEEYRLQEATMYTLGKAQWALNGWWNSEDMEFIDDVVRQHVNQEVPSFWSLASIEVGVFTSSKVFSALEENTGSYFGGASSVEKFAVMLREALQSFVTHEEQKVVNDTTVFTRHYIEFEGYQDSWSESVEERLSPAELPENCYGFRFYDRVEVQFGEDLLTSDRKNISQGTYYGEICDENMIFENFTINGEIVDTGDRTMLHEVLEMYREAVAEGDLVIKTRSDRFRRIPAHSTVVQRVRSSARKM